jgi:Putative bacterial sensory transduction regulator
MSGYNVRVFFFDCNNQGCGNFQYWSGFTKQESFTLEYVNAWNNQWRFAKANLDSDGNLIFSADVVVGGGVTLDNIKATAQLFDGLMSELAKFNP